MSNTKKSQLIASGERKINWVAKHMPIVSKIIDENLRLQQLSGYTIVTSVHMEAKTAYLVQALAKLGAMVYATGCNPLSTQDDVALALNETPDVSVYAEHNCSDEEY